MCVWLEGLGEVEYCSVVPINGHHGSAVHQLTMFHHHSEELDDDSGAGSYQHLPLASLLCVTDRHQGVAQHVHTHHDWIKIAQTGVSDFSGNSSLCSDRGSVRIN